jgi:DNA primase
MDEIMNLSEILSQFVEVEKSGHLHSCCCPFHPDDKKSMRINDAKRHV